MQLGLIAQNLFCTISLPKERLSMHTTLDVILTRVACKLSFSERWSFLSVDTNLLYTSMLWSWNGSWQLHVSLQVNSDSVYKFNYNTSFQHLSESCIIPLHHFRSWNNSLHCAKTSHIKSRTVTHNLRNKSTSQQGWEITSISNKLLLHKTGFVQ